MRIALIQMESKGDKKENEQKAFEMLKDAVKEKPDIICLSELFLSWGKDFENGTVELSEIEKYQQFAKDNKVNIILGSVALKSNADTKTTNTCFTINREGKIVKRYDKKYMYQVNRPDFKLDEMEDTIPGTEDGIAVLDGVKVGLAICFDLRFPEYFRALTKQGVQIIFLPSHFRKDTGEKAWDILVNARAIENQVYICACNQTGPKLCGKTKVISYDGSILKQIEEAEGILTVDLDLEGEEQFRKEFPVLKQMR